MKCWSETQNKKSSKPQRLIEADTKPNQSKINRLVLATCKRRRAKQNDGLRKGWGSLFGEQPKTWPADKPNQNLTRCRIYLIRSVKLLLSLAEIFLGSKSCKDFRRISIRVRWNVSVDWCRAWKVVHGWAQLKLMLARWDFVNDKKICSSDAWPML